MLMRDEPSAIDLAQDAGAATTASRFLAANEALPAKLVAAGGHVIGDDAPDDVVKTKDLVFDELESLLKCPLRRCFADKSVLRENEYSIFGDTRRDLFPRMRVELFDVGRESGFVVHDRINGDHTEDGGKK